MIFDFYVNNCKVTMEVFHEYNVKTDKHIFDFQSIHIDNIFFPDVDDALLILGLTVNQFTKIVLNQFFSLN
jgi:hypothetical protein